MMVDVTEQDVRNADLIAEKLHKVDQVEARVNDLIRSQRDRRISISGAGDDLLEVLSPRDKQLAAAVEKAGPQVIAGKAYGAFTPDPLLRVATGRWLKGHLTKLTRPGDFDREGHRRLTEALGGIHKVAMQEDTAEEGGNLVPVRVEAEILRLVTDNSVMRPLVRTVPMTTKIHAYPTRAAAITAAIIPEEGSITDSVPSNPFSQSNLVAKKFAAFATVSGELMVDNVVLLSDFLAQEFAEQIGRAEDLQALEGDGTGVNFTGVVAATGVNSKTSGTNGDYLSYAMLTETAFAAGERLSRRGAMWFVSTGTLKALYQSRVSVYDGSGLSAVGVPLFAPAAGIAPAAPTTLLGWPFAEHSGILSNRTVGSGSNRTNLYFGPPRTIIFGDRLGFQIDLNPYAKFQTDQIDIRGIKRTGILVAVPTAWTKYTGIDASGPMLE